jgi:uncharacterized protein
MRVLVTGASGAIGRMACDALLARGDEVVGLSRDPGRARATNPTVTWHAWRPAAERPPAAALVEVDAVVNLIGEDINQRLDDEARRRIRESRERATKNLVDAIAAADPRPRVLVSQSAAGYYGIDQGDALLDEDHPPAEHFLSQLVVGWESAAQQAEGAGVRVVRLRSAPVLDAASGFLRQVLLPFRLGVGGPIGSGRQYFPWIHRDDEVGAFLWALDNEQATGAYNATAPTPITNREFSKALGRALRRPAVMPVPKLAVRALRGPDVAEFATGSLRVVPRRLLDAGFRFRFPEIDPALRDLVGR